MSALLMVRHGSPLVLIAGLAFACTPANVGSVPADAHPTTDAGGNTDAGAGPELACQEYAYAWCNRTKTCSVESFQTRYGTESACETKEQAVCMLANLSPSTSQTPTTTAACTAALDTWLCSDFLHSQNRPPACENQKRGLLPNGASCMVIAQCQSGFCEFAYGQACGTCAQVPPPGTSCVSTSCPPGLQCLAGACIAVAEQGSACSATSPCDDGFSCVGGICTPGITTLGASCSYTGIGCDVTAGLTCNAATQRCEVLQIAQVGQACGVVANQNVVCLASACERGACVGFRQLGESCVPGAGTACAALTRCILSADGGATGPVSTPAPCPVGSRVVSTERGRRQRSRRSDVGTIPSDRPTSSPERPRFHGVARCR